jgi:hypothetical protein
VAFRHAWEHLQDLIEGGGVHGPLDDHVALAGSSRGDSRHLQRAITAQVEQVMRDRLHEDIVALPLSSQRQCAWVSAGRGLHMFIVSRPTHDFKCSPQEFREMMTTWRATPNRVCARGDGRRDAAPRAARPGHLGSVLTSYGFTLLFPQTGNTRHLSRRECDTTEDGHATRNPRCGAPGALCIAHPRPL